MEYQTVESLITLSSDNTTASYLRRNEICSNDIIELNIPTLKDTLDDYKNTLVNNVESIEVQKAIKDFLESIDEMLYLALKMN